MKQYLTSEEATHICAVHINTINNWVRKGEIETIQSPGGRWRILSASLVRFMQTSGMTVPEGLAKSPTEFLSLMMTLRFVNWCSVL